MHVIVEAITGRARMGQAHQSDRIRAACCNTAWGMPRDVSCAGTLYGARCMRRIVVPLRTALVDPRYTRLDHSTLEYSTVPQGTPQYLRVLPTLVDPRYTRLDPFVLRQCGGCA